MSAVPTVKSVPTVKPGATSVDFWGQNGWAQVPWVQVTAKAIITLTILMVIALFKVRNVFLKSAMVISKLVLYLTELPLALLVIALESTYTLLGWSGDIVNEDTKLSLDVTTVHQLYWKGEEITIVNEDKLALLGVARNKRDLDRVNVAERVNVVEQVNVVDVGRMSEGMYEPGLVRYKKRMRNGLFGHTGTASGTG